MFTHLKLTNFAAFANLDWPDHAAMNVIIGENDTGKTHLLKLLYVFGRSVNEFQKSKEGPLPKGFQGIFFQKLIWTFQPKDLEMLNLRRHGAESFQVEPGLGCGQLYCSLGATFNERKTRVISILLNKDKTDTNYSVDTVGPIGRTVFLPPKEILTAMQAIEATRKRIEIAGFDDTYLDLIEDFRAALTYGKIESGLKNIPDTIKKILDGGEIIEKGLEFVFQKGDEEYSLSQTAEGFKKIGILSRLILNRSITKGSILLVDEPEANLHPKAIIAMADILFDLSQAGVQVYTATHSFYFLSRIEQRAREAQSKPVSLVDLRRSENGVTASFHDLRDGIPDNPILQQSEYLLNEAIRLDWED